jgi:hypothetical protein
MRLLDEQVLAYQRKLREEMEAGITRIVEYCLASDATAQDVLGFTPASYEKVLGPAGALTAKEKKLNTGCRSILGVGWSHQDAAAVP